MIYYVITINAISFEAQNKYYLKINNFCGKMSVVSFIFFGPSIHVSIDSLSSLDGVGVVNTKTVNYET